MAEVSTDMEYDQDTKNKVRFKETSNPGTGMKYLYLDRESYKSMGSPRSVEVTVKPKETA